MVVTMSSTCFGAVDSKMLENADSAYNAQNFRSALSLYNQVLDNEGANSQLYYNLGNTHYRLGNIGKAVVNYERALRLDPSNEDARANLEFVNSGIKGLPEDGTSFLTTIHKHITSYATPDGWSIVAFVLFLLVLTCVGLYLFASGTSLRKTGFFGGIVLFVLFIYALVIAWQTSTSHENHEVAVVVSPKARLTSNPGTAKNKTEKTISIPEGTKIEILDSLSTPNDPVTAMWYNVALNSNTEAWIDASDVERI